MILNYTSFNENLRGSNIKIVNVNGVHQRWDPANRGIKEVKVINQTGIFMYQMYNRYTIIFDNYFAPEQYSVEGSEIKRYMDVSAVSSKLDIIENIDLKTKENKFSKKFERIFSTIEIIYPNELDVDYIDITDNNDMISYLSKKRINRLNGQDPWNNNLRQSMKIGKFIMLYNPRTDKKSLEIKVNIYKSLYDNIISNKYKFELVTGEDIRFWYDEKNYFKGSGKLNKSCMRHNYKAERLNLYAYNPDKVALLIMTNNENKLLGRALVWKVSEPNITYMDRIYCVYDDFELAFKKYADDQGWEIRDTNKFKKMKIYFDYDLGEPEDNPYMDSFYYFVNDRYSKKMFLTNDVDDYEDLRFYEYQFNDD